MVVLVLIIITIIIIIIIIIIILLLCSTVFFSPYWVSTLDLRENWNSYSHLKNIEVETQKIKMFCPRFPKK